MDFKVSRPSFVHRLTDLKANIKTSTQTSLIPLHTAQHIRIWYHMIFVNIVDWL